MVKRRKPADDDDDTHDNGWGGGGKGGGFAAKRPNAGFTMMSTQPTTNVVGVHAGKGGNGGEDAEEVEEDGEDLTFSFMPKKKEEEGEEHKDRRRALLHHTIIALNTQFRAWVNRRYEESDGGKYEFWGLGVVSYLEHEQKIRDDFKDVLSAAGVTGPAPRPPPALNASAAPFVSSKSPPAAAAAAPLFGGAASKSTAAPAPFAPTSTTTTDRTRKDGESGSAPKPALVNPVAAAGGLFGNLKSGVPQLGSFATTSTTTTALPTFGSGTTTTTSAAAPSIFGSTAAPAAAATPAAGGTEEEDPPRPPSPSVADGDDNVVVHFTSKAKMFLKTDGEWKDLGVGVLSVRSEKEGEPKPRICLRNSGGKLRLNSNIYKGIKVSVQKNTVTAQLQYSASDDAEPKLEIILLRLKTPELCKDLADAINTQAQE